MSNTTRIASLMAIALLLGACGGSPPPTIEAASDPAGDVDASDDASADADGADVAPDEVTPVAMPECLGWDDPVTYSPPAEEQPPAEPGVTDVAHHDDIAIRYEEDVPERPDGVASDGEVYGALRAWAEREAPDHFAGMWGDEDSGFIVGFTDDVERYAEQVRDRFGAGWWVVEASYTEAELERVQREVHDGIPWPEDTSEPLPGVDEVGEPGGGRFRHGTPPGSVPVSSIDIRHGQVEVHIVGGDDDLLADVAERFDHPAICWHVLPPPPTPDLDGPVRTLATVRDSAMDSAPAVGQYHLAVAEDRTSAERLFADQVPDDLPPGDGHPSSDGLHAGLDTVDWDHEVVAVYATDRGGCPEWINDLAFDGEVVEIQSASPSVGACPDILIQFRAVLAIDRDCLPSLEELPVRTVDRFGNSGEVVVYPTRETS